MSDKYNIINVKLSNESIITKNEDNTLHESFYQQAIKRSKEDSLIRIKIAEESANRSEEDSKLSIRISNEIANRVEEDSKLKINLNNLEEKVNKIEKILDNNYSINNNSDYIEQKKYYSDNESDIIITRNLVSDTENDNTFNYEIDSKIYMLEKAEAERIAKEKAEAERIAKEKAEAIAREKAEAERIAREKAEAIAREKAEAIAREKAEAIAKEKAEAERIAREKAEAERIAQIKAEYERLINEKEESEKISKEKDEMERLAKERAEYLRIAEEKEEAEQNIKLKELEIILEEKLSFEENIRLIEIEKISKEKEKLEKAINIVKENENINKGSKRYSDLEKILINKYNDLSNLNKNLLVLSKNNPINDLKIKITKKKITKNEAIYTLKNYLSNIIIIEKNIRQIKLDIFDIKSEMVLLTKKEIKLFKTNNLSNEIDDEDIYKILKSNVSKKPTLSYSFYSYISMENNELFEDDFIGVIINNELRGKGYLKKSNNIWTASINIELENNNEPNPTFYLVQENRVIKYKKEIKIDFKIGKNNIKDIKNLTF